MHLEILYKSVGFLNRKQIMSELSKYKEGKEIGIFTKAIYLKLLKNNIDL